MDDWMDREMGLQGRIDGRMGGNALPNQQQQTENIGWSAHIRLSKGLIFLLLLIVFSFLTTEQHVNQQFGQQGKSSAITYYSWYRICIFFAYIFSILQLISLVLFRE